MGRISLGISLGGIIVILGFVAMTFWSFWIGLIVTIIGLILFIPTKNRSSKQPG
jgi:tetrahydromethanopterin S-methyltransferase subunit B